MWKVAKFVRLPAAERRLFWEAVFWCAVARLAIVCIPFRKYYWLLGKPQENSEAPEPVDTFFPCLAEIGKAVRRASRHVPWKTRCLVEAIAAKRMLSRRKIACRIYLGVAKDKHGHMRAHAWLKSGNIILTGKNSLKKYTVVTRFD